MKKITLLTSLDEPSDEQLSDLMKEVAQEAKRKASSRRSCASTLNQYEKTDFDNYCRT
jgi:hypothetical protein